MTMVPFQIRVESELWAEIQRLAKNEGVSGSNWIRERLWATIGYEAGLRGETVEDLLARARAAAG